MKFTTTYLLHPKESDSISPEKLGEILLNQFTMDTKCKAKLVEGKIVFARERLFYSYRWLFTRMMDGAIHITRKEPYLAIEGTLIFPNLILILWLATAAFLSAFLIYTGFPFWIVILVAGAGLAFVVAFNWIFGVISFNAFLKNSIRSVGEVVDRRSREIVEKT